MNTLFCAACKIRSIGGECGKESSPGWEGNHNGGRAGSTYEKRGHSSPMPPSLLYLYPQLPQLPFPYPRWGFPHQIFPGGRFLERNLLPPTIRSPPNTNIATTASAQPP